jgi:hypothetical protein
MKTEINSSGNEVIHSEFKEWRSPRFGKSNPERIKSNIWKWLVHSGLSGYSSTQKMNGPSPIDEGPTWSFDRSGKTTTKLPDGRTVFIGGEHEDYYDSDFYIYNDVIIEMPDGDIDFYCYPKNEFPPTDSHSATLIDDKIIIIGNLGYPQERKREFTQIYVLDLNTYKISKIESSGDFPGWIHKHEAMLTSDKDFIIIKKGLIDFGDNYPLRENIDEWKLNIKNWHWERLTKKKWTRWELTRKDKANNHLYDIRQVLWNHTVNWQEYYEKSLNKLETSLGFKVDLNLIKTLYDFDLNHEKLIKDEETFNVYWIYIDGIRVRFVEEDYCLQVSIEGIIDGQILESMKDQLVNHLSELERTTWILEEY